jgi:putative oxidoreductase
MGVFCRIVTSQAPCSTFLIRLIVGGTFLSAGIQEFVLAEDHGIGRFAEIGIPYPEIAAPLVGVCEIGCGTMLILGLLTRLAALAMIVNISVAIVSTKIPLLLGHGVWLFALPKSSSYGLGIMIYEARADFAMLLGGIFLLIVGAGWLSIDALLAGISRARDAERILVKPKAWAGIDLDARLSS